MGNYAPSKVFYKLRSMTKIDVAYAEAEGVLAATQPLEPGYAPLSLTSCKKTTKVRKQRVLQIQQTKEDYSTILVVSAEALPRVFHRHPQEQSATNFLQILYFGKKNIFFVEIRGTCFSVGWEKVCLSLPGDYE